MKLTKEELSELFYSLNQTQDYYKENLQEMLSIEEEEDVKRSINYWYNAIQENKKLEERLREAIKKGEL